MKIALPAAPVVTMTSLELVEYINTIDPRQTLTHANFLAKVPKVLGGVIQPNDTYTHPQNGQTYPCYKFSKREACLMAMSYSYDLQAKVFDRMTELEARATPALPDFTNPAAAARAWADAVDAAQALLIERDHAIATKAQIGSKREATAMATASAAKKESAKLRDQLGFNTRHATVKAVDAATKKPHAWLPLRKWCTAHGVEPQSVTDPLYGTVKTWPADAWGEVYGVDLQELFGEVV